MKNIYNKKVIVLEIFSLNNYYHVKLPSGSYEMIYRAARGVYWDEKTASLYFKGSTSQENALKIISEAMECEYGIHFVY